MTPTEELRAMLDERGVEWWSINDRQYKDTITHWRTSLIEWMAIEDEMGLWLTTSITDPNSLSAEQVIAATLGPGTCSDVHEPPRNTTFWPCPHFKCSECGATHVSLDYVYYCPNCGRKVVDE